MKQDLLKVQFGSEDEADKLTLEEFASLPDRMAEDLLRRAAKGSFKIAGEISAIRERAKQAQKSATEKLSTAENAAAIYARIYKEKNGSELPQRIKYRFHSLESKLITRFIHSPMETFAKVSLSLSKILMTSTKNQIVKQTSCVLDGIIGQGGQGIIYYAIDGLDIKCAKVGSMQQIMNEWDAGNKIKAIAPNCSTILLPHAVYEADKNERTYFLLFDLLPYTLEKLPDTFEHQLRPLVLRTFLCMLFSLLVLDRANLYHNDIKPSNIGYRTISERKGTAVLFDLGSVSTPGELINSTTADFGLDQVPGTPLYDLTCLISTIGVIIGVPLENKTLSQYIAAIESKDAIIGAAVRAVTNNIKEPMNYLDMIYAMRDSVLELESSFSIVFDDMEDLVRTH